MVGATLLSESLSEYTALKVLEKEYGKSYLKRVLRYNLDAYLHYNKGALASHGISSVIGETAVNRALAGFLKEDAFQGPPYPVAPELLQRIRAAARPEQRTYLTDLFEKITL